MVASVFFFNFQSGKASNGKKTTSERLPKVACTFSRYVHVCTCTPAYSQKNIGQLRRPILTYAESFVRILPHLAKIYNDLKGKNYINEKKKLVNSGDQS